MYLHMFSCMCVHTRTRILLLCKIRVQRDRRNSMCEMEKGNVDLGGGWGVPMHRSRVEDDRGPVCLRGRATQALGSNLRDDLSRRVVGLWWAFGQNGNCCILLSHRPGTTLC
uniref:Uncharacterized protein n=1 Tax=Sphaerodactylus townsendi TaxID=933632 RepID=A0ACB8EWB6_9SAUR